MLVGFSGTSPCLPSCPPLSLCLLFPCPLAARWTTERPQLPLFTFNQTTRPGLLVKAMATRQQVCGQLGSPSWHSLHSCLCLDRVPADTPSYVAHTLCTWPATIHTLCPPMGGRGTGLGERVHGNREFPTDILPSKTPGVNLVILLCCQCLLEGLACLKAQG
jgi:hypothetical protein